MPYRISAELHPMEYFSRLNIDFDDLAEDSDLQDDEPSTESTSASSSLSYSLSSSSSSPPSPPSPSSHSGEEEKISTPDNSNHSIGTPETSDDDEDSVDLDELFRNNTGKLEEELLNETDNDEPRRQSCPDPHTLRKLCMALTKNAAHSDKLGRRSFCDSAVVLRKELASIMCLPTQASFGRQLSLGNAAA